MPLAFSVSGASLVSLGDDGARGRPEYKPLGGASHAAPTATSFGDADGVVALFG